MSRLGLGLGSQISGGKLIIYDADALTYINAVQAADGQSLEIPVKLAINDFVIGCKSDSIWSAIKASCILAGARTLTGALVPLAGTAPTNNGFVSGDYDRKNGFTGSGTGKYLYTGYTDEISVTLPQNNSHVSVYVTANPLTASRTLIGSFSSFGASISIFSPASGSVTHQHKGGTTTTPLAYQNGFLGLTRNISTTYTFRSKLTNYTITRNSNTGGTFYGEIWIFGTPASLVNTSNATISFYSLGENINLSLLDSRLATLMNTFSSVIP